MIRPGFHLAILCTVSTTFLVGCRNEKVPEFGQVTGTVTAKGKPLKGIIVTFMPDPTKGNDNPFNASGQTDAQGKYVLRHSFKGHEGEGAPIGWNRVIAVDTRYSSIPQGAPLPPQLFGAAYSAVTSTPLKYEVKPGPQTIDLELK
jgi:hypothetical protein